ncbi:MAG: hypothetical protein JW750_05700 [Anaerolineaceae bacterium]|nr:hypothetical protein [Anaerolineaceae bacterium]
MSALLLVLASVIFGGLVYHSVGAPEEEERLNVLVHDHDYDDKIVRRH